MNRYLMVAAAVGLLALVGCGGGTESNTTPTHTVSAKAGAQARRMERTRLRRQAVRRAVLRQRAAGWHRRNVAAHRRALRHARVRAAQLRAAQARRRAGGERRAESEAASECDPNYAGACLSPTASDYDCEGGSGDGPEYTGMVTVVGEDHYGLDSDSDGVGCE
jgi:hypothetical protein